MFTRFCAAYRYIAALVTFHVACYSNMKLESAESSSLEDRVKRNIHSIQRTPASLDNFMKRWKGILCFKMTRTSQPFFCFWYTEAGVLFRLSLYMVTVMYIKHQTCSQTLHTHPHCDFLNFTMGMYLSFIFRSGWFTLDILIKTLYSV